MGNIEKAFEQNMDKRVEFPDYGKEFNAIVTRLQTPVDAPGFEYPARANAYLDMTADAGRKYGLPDGLMDSLIHQESRWNPNAKSKKGAIGLAQIVPKWHPGIDATDPETSIYYSAKYLRKLIDRYGNIEDGLRAYNWGLGNLDKYKRGEKKEMPKETREYSNKILSRIRGKKSKSGSSVDKPLK